MNKIISWLKTFVFGEEEEEQKGTIHIVTPEIEVKADFKDEESMRRVKRIIDNEIELRFERMVEMR